MIGLLMGGLRGGQPETQRPIRGAEKAAYSLIDDVLFVADGVVQGRVGQEAALEDYERMLIKRGATGYMSDGIATKVVKYMPTVCLIAGTGIWAWRIFDVWSARKANRATAPVGSVHQALARFQQAPPRPAFRTAPAQVAPSAQVAPPIMGSAPPNANGYVEDLPGIPGVPAWSAEVGS